MKNKIKSPKQSCSIHRVWWSFLCRVMSLLVVPSSLESQSWSDPPINHLRTVLDLQSVGLGVCVQSQSGVHHRSLSPIQPSFFYRPCDQTSLSTTYLTCFCSPPLAASQVTSFMKSKMCLKGLYATFVFTSCSKRLKTLFFFFHDQSKVHLYVCLISILKRHTCQSDW